MTPETAQDIAKLKTDLAEALRRIGELENQPVTLSFPLSIENQAALQQIIPLATGTQITGAKAQAGYIPVNINGILTNLLTG